VEGSFTTGAAPSPRAETGGAGAVGATSATVTGMVDPDGLPATYAFELGIDEGAGTQYGIVFSASAGSGSVPIGEALALTGLQPGTTYAYRITVSSGYINNPAHTLLGASATFTTLGLASVLSLPAVLAQVSVPNIAFPSVSVGSALPRNLTRAQLLARALRVCAKKPRKQQRVACRKQAQRKYAKSKQAKR
jgi:hypothetical protein